jgi:2-methylcitrate dehydratase PrpD
MQQNISFWTPLAVGSLVTTDRGKMSIAMAKKMGGPPESSIIGVGDKVSNVSAAYVNGELINSTDYDTLIFPGGHIPPYVIPPTLAVAESKNVSGKDCFWPRRWALKLR